MNTGLNKSLISCTDKEFYKIFMPMYLILMLQNLVTLSVNLADNIMLGAYHQNALSGVATVNTIQFVYQQVLVAMGDGFIALGTQYLGKNQLSPVKKVASSAMQSATVLGCLLTLVMSLFPLQIMSLFTNDRAIVSEAVAYVSVIRYSYIIFAISMMLIAMLRSSGLVHIAFYLSIVTLAVNCCINYVLIFGHFGAPELGVVGAAIGTLSARIVELLILIGYILIRKKHTFVRFTDFLHVHIEYMKDYLRFALPLAATQALWGFSSAIQTAILGHVNSIAIAASSVTNTVFMMVKSACYGGASASGVLIGKSIGEGTVAGDYSKTQHFTHLLQRVYLLNGIVGCVILLAVRRPVLSLYHLTPETMTLTMTFMAIMAVIYIGVGYHMPIVDGIIKVGGSPGFAIGMSIIGIYLIVIPSSLLMAFVFHAPAPVVFFFLNWDQLFNCIPVFWKVNRGHWIKNLTREQE